MINGSCHCGNLSYELDTDIAPAAIQARACDCSFCCKHGARNWSDPDGSAVIRVRDESLLQRYLFALRTAEFFICRNCGSYLGAVLANAEGRWSTLNLRLSGLGVAFGPVSFAGEDEAGRIDRRMRLWTPTEVLIEG